MDANFGFWQITLDEDSREYTAFITHFGRDMLCKLPVGISVVLEFIHREMAKTLTGLEGVMCIIDDTLLVGKKEKHMMKEWKKKYYKGLGRLPLL